MSGQTYETTIRIPTPHELAEQAAADAKAQGTAHADIRDIASGAANLPRAVQGLRAVLSATATLTRKASTLQAESNRAAEVEVTMGSARVPLSVTVDPSDSGRAKVQLRFARAHGLSCADEADLMSEVTALLAAGGLQPIAPTGSAVAAGATYSSASREQQR
jgi:hypothetical protein